MIQYSRREQLRSRDTSRNYSAVSCTRGLPDFSVDLVIHQSSVGDDIITHKDSLLRITPTMGEIYKCAETVHVWLGDVDADEVVVAFANIRMVQAFSTATESYKTDLCNSLTMLTQKPWLSRRWVIQEIKLADRAVLRYGEHCVEYARFRAAWYLVESRLLTQGNLGYLRHLLRCDVTDDLLELL
ncbi:hypothetical protein CABS01_01368 [Colletotrichum abscissum]|uniref:Heterokaryon incompatibility domain-containing protein n=1 Tax=Colletotrichum abscissum TaxID=1671311 RepID=A0A9P9X3P6_9PEZI|nr:uncharacterized protein CABS01_01368 [Colletotrichum abscissum]KAI3535078.1 hypothetical protein CABS02_13036 [Colletotrichum abscissum]KAK1495561.1 hypothetical protein CABS01_01368 [Colletotrichum abscissum]